MNSKIFPCVLMLLMVCASIVYAINGNIRMAIYWIAGATITATVTF